ncbi:hypothetical protein [Nitrosomonas sp.]|uniref:hypothetical protein n=1 Tax=Nitrosomonas sp. TaxID=42353 RepID=UPI00208049AC|nr:hypothetical protein [Nitrosomonas sp.]GJL76740.1 MAG: hypothetical protein NMNS02_28460 [Nitrosomonas sp.]
MKPTDFWKNFKLGEEISVSGTFIYNGLRRYHEMQKLDFTDEIFEFLYDLSVGFERLLKIAVILFEHSETIDQEELEKSLITHSHLDLLARLRKHVEVNTGPPQIDLLALLGKFYKSHRYDRFSLSSAYDGKKEREALCSFLQKHLNFEISNNPSIFGTANEDRYRQFIRRNTLKISRTLYTIIKTRASQINLYTYELRSGSKAETVFFREVDISDEDVLWKELLIFFINTKSSSGYLEFLRGIPPLDFDPVLVGDYLDCFKSDASKAFIMDELEHHYTEMEGKVVDERLKLMSVIGSPNVHFDSDDDDSLDEELG